MRKYREKNEQVVGLMPVDRAALEEKHPVSDWMERKTQASGEKRRTARRKTCFLEAHGAMIRERMTKERSAEVLRVMEKKRGKVENEELRR